MSPYLRAGTLYEIGAQELGEALLVDAFHCAAVGLGQNTSARWEQLDASTIQQSVLFLNGSGLEATIQTFALPFQAATLRETFAWKLRHLASSSAIIPVGS